MPAQTSTSLILSKLGNRLDSAIKKALPNPVDYGRQGLPPGIRNGIARIAELRCGEFETGDNAGKPFFRAAGSVAFPTHFDYQGSTIKIYGQFTSVMEKLFDTTYENEVTTEEKHWNNVINLCKSVSSFDFVNNFFKQFRVIDGKSVEMMFAAIIQRNKTPGLGYFKFTTSERKGREYLDPKTKKMVKSADGVWENWNGNEGIEVWTPPATTVANGMQDGTGKQSTQVPTPHQQSQSPQPNGQQQEHLQEQQHHHHQESSSADADGGLSELVEKAVQDDAEAQTRLRAIASAAGVSEELIDGTQTWQELMDLIVNANGSSPDGADHIDEEMAAKATAEESPQWSPQVGQMYKHQVISPVTKKPMVGKDKKPLRPVDVEVMAVNSENKTVDLRNVTDQKVMYKGVLWEALIKD